MIDPPPLYENAPPLDQSDRAKETTERHFSNAESSNENLLFQAKLQHHAASVLAARHHLYIAQFGLADDGFDCLRLNDIVYHVSLLLSDWRLAQGRPDPLDPEWVAMWDRLAEREWAEQRRRRPRRWRR